MAAGTVKEPVKTSHSGEQIDYPPSALFVPSASFIPPVSKPFSPHLQHYIHVASEMVPVADKK